ncbi:MAG TPA: hypothetical protein VMG38_01320 [Trebonia sp.]|nr:hypothetical protein [Trebonia sp.]
MTDHIADTFERLFRSISQVTADEFQWHDVHYNRDSRLGRELLYLIANDDWIRSTTEVINLGRSDAVDTTVAVSVDLSKVTHEAFGEGYGWIWLPLLVPSTEQDIADSEAAQKPLRTRLLSQGEAGQVIVTGLDGSRLAPLPDGDTWHAISAALADVFVTMADALWPWPDEERPGVDRDQRVVLSAAVFRLLSRGGEDWRNGASGHANGRDRVNGGADHGALSTARGKLDDLLRRYAQARQVPGTSDGPSRSASTMAERAAGIIEAFAQASVVVVGVGREQTPTILSLAAPTRKLVQEHRSWWRLRPRARLEIDLLLPSSDADRQVEINVPDGLSVDAPAARREEDVPGNRADLVVQVALPPAAGRLATLLRGAAGAPPGSGIRQSLLDLAIAQADTLAAVLDQHYVLAKVAAPTGAEPDAAWPGHARLTRSQAERRTYKALKKDTLIASQELDSLRGKLQSPETSPSDLAALERAWREAWLSQRVLQRHASVSVPSPDKMTGQVGLLENTRLRVPPHYARVTVPLEVADARFFSIARFSGGVSMILMLIVGCFFAYALVQKMTVANFSPDAIATALTLFSAIQAGRVEAPDRSTLRGKLVGAGNWLIIGSILPSVLLAVALVFDINGSVPVSWALVTMALQGIFLLAMWRGPLSAAGGKGHPPAQILRTSPPPRYGTLAVLHADWWQSTTAYALVADRPTHARLIWDQSRREAHDQPAKGQLPDTASSRNGMAKPGNQRTNGGVAAEPPGDPSLPGLLRRLQPALATALKAARSDASQRKEPAEVPDRKTEGHSGQATVSALPRTADSDPNILAMLRTDTPIDALTFVVLSGQPNTARRRGEEPIRLDRLVPSEAASSHLDVIVGLPRSAEFPLIRDHPLFAVLAVAKKHYLLVAEVQLPVTPPAARPSNHFWARIRVGIRSAEYGRVRDFLDDAAREIDQLGFPLWFRASPDYTPRQACPGRLGDDDAGPLDAILLTAYDLDVVGAALQRDTAVKQDADDEALPWRTLALCANAGVTAAHRILEAIGEQLPRLGLATLTYAQLQGLAVCFLLGKEEAGPQEPGHDPQGEAAGEDLKSKLIKQARIPGMDLLLDNQRSASQLGDRANHPLVRVHLRTSDMPGKLQVLTDALYEAIRKRLPSPPTADASGWHVLLETRVDHSAEAQMTMRLPVQPADITGGDWSEKRWTEIARDARQATMEAAAERAALGDHRRERHDVPGDMVLTVRPIRWKEPPTPASG